MLAVATREPGQVATERRSWKCVNFAPSGALNQNHFGEIILWSKVNILYVVWQGKCEIYNSEPFSRTDQSILDPKSEFRM